MSLDDFLISPSEYEKEKIIDVEYKNKKAKIGVKEIITWQEKKQLAGEYYDLNMEQHTATVNIEKGDMARYLKFIKWIESDGQRQPMSKSILLRIPPKVIEELEQNIPSMEEVLQGIAGSLKKKSKI